MSAPFVVWWSLSQGGEPLVVARLVRCDFRLPARQCPVCREREIHLVLARYDLPIPDTIKPRAVQRIRTMSPEEFAELARTITTDPETQASLLPGTKLGKPIFGVPVRPIDVVWSGTFRPMLSEEAFKALQERNVNVNVTEVEVAVGGMRSRRFFSIIPKVCEVLSHEWLSREQVQCSTCQQWTLRPGLGFPRETVFTKAHVVASRWPHGSPVVFAPSLSAVFYSPEFVQAFLEAKLSGAEFKQVRWV